MSNRRIVSALILLFALTSFASADLRRGESIGVFYVTKVAGAENDGVKPGEDLCYRCRYGSSPMVMVFVRKTDGRVVKLVDRLERAVTRHRAHRLRGLVTLIGDDVALLREDGKLLANRAGAKQVPVVIAKQSKTGPLNYRLPRNADVTIIVAKDSQVLTTLNYDAEDIDLDKVLSNVSQAIH